MNNILVIKLRYIGDVLLATPVLRALREAFSHATLTMAVNAGTEDIVKGNPDLDKVLVVPKGTLGEQVRFASELRRRRFDCVIDLTDGDRAAILSRLSGAPIRVGFNQEHRWRGLLYTAVAKPRAEDVHRVERDLSALRCLGLEPKAGPLVLNVPPHDEEAAERILREAGVVPSSSTRLVMFHPGARYWFKAWPAERFADLADRLTKAWDCRVLIGGDDRDRETAERIRTHARSAPIVLAGRARLLQFAAILKRCALYVGNDNGAMHMAAALGVPVVGLFGPSNPREWGPRGPSEIIYKGLDCRICFHPTCRRGEGNCMRLIAVDEVFAAAMRLWGLRGRGQGAAG
ncbi:MAG TPA: putative lipopolysaccharide heptosyltransferase III [Nitrospiraceae bacterium]|jgi:predicted lipopolysaccharide heptosyltransferase III|nr:putative lipopolysaccharide heptosyltransferase III [Nitrospiraceae bacterium]